MAADAATKLPDHLRELAKELPITLNLAAAASVLCMHQRSLRRLIASGAIRATRSSLNGSGRIIITRSEVLRWFADHPAH